MRQLSLVSGFAAALAGLFAGSAHATGYGTYSGAGFNPAFIVVLPPSDLPPPWRNPAPLGTRPNPVPVYGPATAVQVGRTILYNAPPSPDDLYRILPHR